MIHLTYLEAAVVGLVQGVSELFPVSSLGHNVLIPALIGGSWARDLNVSRPESPYLAFIVGLHVATAIALLLYFWRDWVRVIGGFFSSLRHIARPPAGTSRWQLRSADERLAWMIILATIPVGIVGLAFEHLFRVIFGKPVFAAVFLTVNGLILLAGERYVRRRSARQAVAGPERELALTAAGDPDAGPLPTPRPPPPVTRPSAPRRSPRPRSPTGGCRPWATARRCSSGRRRSWPCWPASAAAA